MRQGAQFLTFQKLEEGSVMMTFQKDALQVLEKDSLG